MPKRSCPVVTVAPPLHDRPPQSNSARPGRSPSTSAPRSFSPTSTRSHDVPACHRPPCGPLLVAPSGPVPGGADFGLTAREREADMVACGASNGKIAKAQYINTKTASVHVSDILRNRRHQPNRSCGHRRPLQLPPTRVPTRHVRPSDRAPVRPVATDGTDSSPTARQGDSRACSRRQRNPQSVAALGSEISPLGEQAEDLVHQGRTDEGRVAGGVERW